MSRLYCMRPAVRTRARWNIVVLATRFQPTSLWGWWSDWPAWRRRQIIWGACVQQAHRREVDELRRRIVPSAFKLAWLDPDSQQDHNNKIGHHERPFAIWGYGDF